MTFPVEFKECPLCHCKDTVCKLACSDESTVAPGTFVSMEKKITPIQDFTKISTPTIRVLLRHYDTCADCGFDYCTKVEKTTIPTEALMGMMGLKPQQLPQRRQTTGNSQGNLILDIGTYLPYNLIK